MSEVDIHSVPLFCPVCDYAMNPDTDLIHYATSGACFDCTISYFEKNRDKWKEGWRPDLKASAKQNTYCS
jgi:hypothetical protein